MRAGADPDLFQVVTGPGFALGAPLIDAVDAVMFTGSTATGSAVASRAGARLIPVSAELGGKNPLIVRADAPVGRAVRGTLYGKQDRKPCDGCRNFCKEQSLYILEFCV